MSPHRAAPFEWRSGRLLLAVAGGVLDDDAAERLARLFRALADRHRVRLLSMIAAADGGEACICDLTEPLGLSQPLSPTTWNSSRKPARHP